jgi:transcriptional regulator GlxA family with amidase domain
MMRIAIVLYQGFDELDAIGPYEVLRSAAAGGAPVEVLLVTSEPIGAVRGAHGLILEPQGKLEGGLFDLVIVPGGGWNDRAPAGAWAEAKRGELPAALRRLHDGGAPIATVCTGAMLVATAGMAKGRPMTTHSGALEDLGATGADLVEARVVDDGDLLSCGGVTSGIDLALWIVEREWGQALAEALARERERERRGQIWTRERDR